MLKKNSIADFKLLKERPLLILCLLSPFLIAIILKLIFPLISSLLESLFNLAPEDWLTLVIITLISSIPIITGLLISYMHTYARSLPRNTVLIKSEVIGSLVEPFLVTLFLILLCIVITNPVPSEGWLRILFISVVLSLYSPYVFIIHKNRYLQNVGSVFFYCMVCYWLSAVPFGLMLSKPWHYFAFLSPFYWISWSWLTPSFIESAFLGAVFSYFSTFNIGFAIFAMFRKRPV
jgi:hypothetical protein